LTLRGDRIAALTWFSDRSILATFALPLTV